MPRCAGLDWGSCKGTGTGKSAPAEPEYTLTWRLQGKRIPGGHFVQIDQVLKGSSAEPHALEILSYDPSNRRYRVRGLARLPSSRRPPKRRRHLTKPAQATELRS